MATTSIWSIKGWLGNVVIYAEDPDKTENPKFFQKQGMTELQTQGLFDVLDYAARSSKTLMVDEHTEIMRHFVTGINCEADTARVEMMAVKKRHAKTEGVVAYHGYQSFAIGEVSAEIAHEIGIKLAEKLWGDKFQVLVTTHLDKEDRLHNHFVLNNVSIVEGVKYYRSKQDYFSMQQESDALCREYGLSVIENPKQGKSKHYVEWDAERKGKPTYRSMIQSDVDTAIRNSMTETQFWNNLKQMGYHVKFGQDITLRPEGKERGLKLYRNFGDDYTIENIRNRILAQSRPERPASQSRTITPPKKVRMRGTYHKTRHTTGLRALYLYYLYRIGALPNKQKQTSKRIYFTLREDIRYTQNISREARLLAKHGIDTSAKLAEYKEGLSAQINSIYDNRRRLRNKLRVIKGYNPSKSHDQAQTIGNDTNCAAETLKKEISGIAEKLKELRREVRLCEDIERRSTEMQDKLREANDYKKMQGGKNRIEQFRGCR